MVGHSSTMEVCSHELLQRKPKEPKELINSISKIPYCGMMRLAKENEKWKVAPFLPLTHGKNPRYDWKMMLNE